jgi:hypothetical protein
MYQISHKIRHGGCLWIQGCDLGVVQENKDTRSVVRSFDAEDILFSPEVLA